MVTRPSELEATARTLYALAERAVLSPTLDAVVLAESAASVARATGATALEFEAERLGARMTYALGDLTRAEARFRGAAAAARALGDGLSLARVDASLAFLAYDRGDALSAEEQLDAVSTSLDRLPHQIEVERHRALVDGYRGNLARQAGDYEGARAHYLRALARAEASEALVPRATFAMDLGATELASGRPSEAALWLARAARSVEALHTGPARTLLTPLVAHYRALLMLSSGERDASLVEIEGPAALLPIRAWLYDAMGTPSSRDLGKRLLLLGRDGAPFEHARFGVTLLAHLRGRRRCCFRRRKVASRAPSPHRSGARARGRRARHRCAGLFGLAWRADERGCGQEPRACRALDAALGWAERGPGARRDRLRPRSEPGTLPLTVFRPQRPLRGWSASA